MFCLCLEMSAKSAEGNLWGAAEGYKGEKAPEGADVYTVNSNGGPGGALILSLYCVPCQAPIERGS